MNPHVRHRKERNSRRPTRIITISHQLLTQSLHLSTTTKTLNYSHLYYANFSHFFRKLFHFYFVNYLQKKERKRKGKEREEEKEDSDNIKLIF